MLFCNECGKLSEGIYGSECLYCGNANAAITDCYMLAVVKILLKKGYKASGFGVQFHQAKVLLDLGVYGGNGFDSLPRGFDVRTVFDDCYMHIEYTYTQADYQNELHREIVEKCDKLLKWARSLPTVEKSGDTKLL